MPNLTALKIYRQKLKIPLCAHRVGFVLNFQIIYIYPHFFCTWRDRDTREREKKKWPKMNANSWIVLDRHQRWTWIHIYIYLFIGSVELLLICTHWIRTALARTHDSHQRTWIEAKQMAIDLDKATKNYKIEMCVRRFIRNLLFCYII